MRMMPLHLHVYQKSDFDDMKPNGVSHYYQLDQSISVLRVVGWCFLFLFKF